MSHGKEFVFILEEWKTTLVFETEKWHFGLFWLYHKIINDGYFIQKGGSGTRHFWWLVVQDGIVPSLWPLGKAWLPCNLAEKQKRNLPHAERPSQVLGVVFWEGAVGELIPSIRSALILSDSGALLTQLPCSSPTSTLPHGVPSFYHINHNNFYVI